MLIYFVDPFLTFLKEMTRSLLMEVVLTAVAQYTILCFDMFKTSYLT